MKAHHGALAVLLLMACSGTAMAGNSLITQGEHKSIAGSSIGATADGEWNRLGRTEGKGIEVWTRDGDALNRVLFFGGIAPGKTLFKDRHPKEAPLPPVQQGMLLPDIPVLLEGTYRNQYGINRMTFDRQEPVSLAGAKAIRFTYSFVRSSDEVERKGEAVALIRGGKLYLVTYEAPALFYFDKDLPAFHRLVDTLRF